MTIGPAPTIMIDLMSVRLGIGDPPGLPLNARAALVIVHRMRPLLQKALKKAAKLPPAEQDAIALAVMEELADDRRWAAKFRKTQGALAGLAKDALAELHTGRAKPMRLRRSK
jgi:hypothetical protein